ncbi:MAG: alpha/beta hydrolase [Mojavia pulchra JT2-VF2]|jgi:lysophospholipase L1-like esterase|uniref:Alpha/beta hydrolase n=1 Tax=Mojavia pulchra JT2-VF2 TaxID=287848 RepID=A0A951Q0I7_9NOST|nr:alpha/beta hydrolase [Mojavia pulchra JT2-VF2]
MNYFYRFLLCLSGCLIFQTVDSIITSSPSFAADKIVVRYGLFEQALPVKDIRKYAETQQVSPDLQSFLRYLSAEQKQQLQSVLQVKMSLDVAALDKLTNTIMGKQILYFVSQAIARRDTSGTSALRSAIIIGSKSQEGLGIVSFLEAYPSNRLIVDLPKAVKLIGMSNLYSSSSSNAPKDDITSSPLGQLALQYQTFATQGKQYSGCLFGDSISAGLGNNFGEGKFNFGLNGLSTISLIEQVKALVSNNVKCEKAVIAIGANDALYGISDEMFSKNLQEAIALVRKMETKEILLLPAFYSTVTASSKPNLAAPLSKVEQINNLINQVAATEKVSVIGQGLAPLYENKALKENLTTDGVHLNAEGLKIYRQALLEIWGN